MDPSASQWVVVDPIEELEKEFVVVDVAKATLSSSSSSSSFSTFFSTIPKPIRISEETRSFLRTSRDTLRLEEEEEEAAAAEAGTREEVVVSSPNQDLETLHDEDVNEELVELEEAYNVKEADEAEERRLLDVLRTSGEMVDNSSSTGLPKIPLTEEEILMEIIASENFGMAYNPFNDPLNRLTDDESLAIALSAQEIHQAETNPHHNRRGWVHEQTQEQIYQQHQERVQRQRELESRISQEMKLEMAKQEELERILNLMNDVNDTKKVKKGNGKKEEKEKEQKKDAEVLPDLPTILTWGKDSVHGCLGRPATKTSEGFNARPPTDLPFMIRFTQVSTGKAHTIALAETGDVWAWGSNTRGQLGNGETGKSYFKPQLTLLSGINVRQVACGAVHTLCLTDLGKIVAFGDNSCGQLGVPVAIGTVRASPVVVRGIEAITVESCAAGDYHSALVTQTRNLYTFGSDSDGQLGLGNVAAACDAPRLVLTLHNKVRSVACGSVHTVAIATDGEVYVWGRKSEGRLGLGPIPSGETKSFTSEPTRNPFLSPATINDTITKVACGGEHTIALSSKGLIFSWGSGRYGQNGSGSFTQVNKPRVVSSLFGVNLKDIACGEFVSTAISEAGDLYSWGMGRNLQLGKGGSDNMTNEAHPSISQQLSNRCIRQVSCGSTHCVALVEGMSAISSAMSSIFNNKEAQADIVLVCDNKRIYCHRAILSLRSLYFRAFLQKAHTEQSPALIAINISNLSYLPLFYLIKFLYTESVAFPDEILEDVIAVAKKMIVPQFEERVKDKKTKLLNRERLGIELISLINDPSFSDIAFTFLNDLSSPLSSSPRKLYAHKAIISARSTYFANMFRWETKSHELSATKQDLSKRQEIAVSCTFEALHSVLQFIYGGRSQGEGIVNGENVVELFELSNQYNLYGLKATCEEVLIEGLDIENVLSLLRLAALHDAANLRNACVTFASKYFEFFVEGELSKEKEKAVTDRASLQEDWNDLQTNQRALASAVETAYKASLPKTRGPGASNASWSYWDKKMKEQDAQFESDDEEEEEEESDDEEDDFPVKTKSPQKTQKKPTVIKKEEISLVLRAARLEYFGSSERIANELKMKASDWKIFEAGKVIPPKDFWVKLVAFYSRQSKPLSAELQELLERLGVRSAAKK